jgi:hypothetical protein
MRQRFIRVIVSVRDGSRDGKQAPKKAFFPKPANTGDRGPLS